MGERETESRSSRVCVCVCVGGGGGGHQRIPSKGESQGVRQLHAAMSECALLGSAHGSLHAAESRAIDICVHMDFRHVDRHDSYLPPIVLSDATQDDLAAGDAAN